MDSSWPDVYESFHSFPGHSVCLLMTLVPQQWARGCSSCKDHQPCLETHPSLLPQGLIPTWLDHVLAASSHDPPGLVQLGLLQTISGKLLQVCAKFISPSRPWDTFYPELLLSTWCSFLNCSGLMSSMLVPARAVIFVETLNKIPSAYFKWESGKIDLYNC